MEKTCTQCGQEFEVTKEDLQFYEDASPVIGGKKQLLPPPTLCSDCRFRRRLAMRNERSLHHRKSDLTGKQIVSMYSPDKPFKVYDQDEWWSDRWNPVEYGRDVDFSKGFFEQLHELQKEVPHSSLYTTNVVNSYYTNYVLHSKDCYLIFGGGHDENCLFGRFIVHCTNTVDGLSLYSCERCYEGIASEKCYGCFFFMNCRNCSDCIMVEDCTGCRNCIACFGLKNAEYCIMNELLGKEEFERRKSELFPLTRSTISALERQLTKLRSTLPHPSAHIYGSEDCTGDMISSSKNCHACFDVTDCEESKYLCYTPKGIHSEDCTYNAPDGVEWCYENCSTVGVRGCLFCFLLRYSQDLLYCIECHNSRNLFGCVGMNKNEYCILNKQYTKEQYEQLVLRIIEHMRTTGEWGEYFPIDFCPYGYNETVVQELFPISADEARTHGWKWLPDEQTSQKYLGPQVSVPEQITEVDDGVCEKILRCEVTGKPFKIIPQELKFYRELHVPLPRKCPDERHRERMAKRNPRKLWTRTCQKCGRGIQTTYQPSRPEIVYCEECYLQTVY